MEASSLLERYRRDRRHLLRFVLSSGLPVDAPTAASAPISDADLDRLSTDYVLDCVKSGRAFDVSEAARNRVDESAYPVMITSESGDSYFLMTDIYLAGSPPRRVPPPVVNQKSNHKPFSSGRFDSLVGESATMEGKSYGRECVVPTEDLSKIVDDVEFSSLGLPSFRTGLTDDDLREAAYEVLLAAMVFSGIEVYSVEYRKKERSTKLLSRVKSKMDRAPLHSQDFERHLKITDVIRVQMQISDAMDSCTRKRLMQFASKQVLGRIDIPQILVGLFSDILKSESLTEKSYMQWKRRQVQILEELLYSSTNHIKDGNGVIRSSIEKILEAKDWDVINSPSDHAKALSAIAEYASKLSSVPGHFNIPGESCYWTTGYHLNLRLYEKLLFGIFDTLEESMLIPETDKFLALVKLTWSILGINHTIHNVLYSWVFFKQFLRTEEPMLLDHAMLELEKVLSAENIDRKEVQYVKSLTCSRTHVNGSVKLSIVQSVFFSMSLWCDVKLRDYHLHFSQKACNFEKVITLAGKANILSYGEFGDIELQNCNCLNKVAAKKVQTYAENSIRAAYKRALVASDLESTNERLHPLALLACKLRLITKREFSEFSPVLRHWCPEAGMISAVILHQLYWERLRPFLEEVTCLSKDAQSVLSAAYMLDCDLIQLYSSACEGKKMNFPFGHDLDHYPIEEVSNPIILDWVISQHAHVLEWTGRALDLEVWEPLSSQQKQAASVVEVFRIIEETVDQFFGLNLPMDITHLQALLSVIFHSLDGYLLKVINQLVEKDHLFPSAPPLTRYTETFIPTIKTKSIEPMHLDENMINKLNELTLPKLCIRLNTIKYIQKQIGMLEEGIRNSWALVRPSADQRLSEGGHGETLDRAALLYGESLDELFLATFNTIQETATNVFSKLRDFTGAKIVFWDLRDSFIFHLYHGNVESARLDSILPHADTVLDNMCGLIVDSIRDTVVLSILRALLEGYVWVLLDGGPFRAFSENDIVMMEEDLNTLKEFFIANGEGLPRSLVEQEAKFAHQILSLFSLQTETLVRMLMAASETISAGLDSHKHYNRRLDSAHTLIRVLCHKRDREASKFLKRQYQLPMSTEYVDAPTKDSSSVSPHISDILGRSSSTRWTEKGQTSFRSLKKKLQEVTSEMKQASWLGDGMV